MRAKGILSETMRRAIKGIQARPATPVVRRVMCASLARTRGNTPQDGPWYLKEGWANAKNWKEPAAGAEAYVTERTPYGGTFFRVSACPAKIYPSRLDLLSMSRPHQVKIAEHASQPLPSLATKMTQHL
jgi:hypothetical protein